MFADELRPKQVEFCEAFRLNQQITFKGGVGFGKTRALATVILWGAVCFDNIQISCFAPSESQLDSGLWKEVGILFNKMPPEFADQFELNTTRLSRRGTAACRVEKRVANKDNPEANRGVHMPRNWVIVDECSGVDDRVLDVLLNVLSDGPLAKVSLVSNPTRSSGYFFETFTHPDKTADWVKVTGAATDNPALTPEGLAVMIRQKGGVTSKKYRIDILGEFPLSNDDGVIPSDLVIEAAHAEGIEPHGPVIWGVDVAGDGTDRSVLVRRQGSVVFKPTAWQGYDTQQVASAVRATFDKTPKHLRPQAICVDAIGIGKGTYDALINMGLPARKIIVARSPTKEPERFCKLRDQLWFACREWFEEGGKSIPNDNDLITELCLPTYEYQNGRVKVEDKKSIRKRGRKSPDVADAFCLTFAVSEAALATTSVRGWPTTPRQFRARTYLA